MQPARAFFGEVDPVRRQKMRHSKEESRFHENGNGSNSPAWAREPRPIANSVVEH
jgi:hypothetical protein